MALPEKAKETQALLLRDFKNHEPKELVPFLSDPKAWLILGNGNRESPQRETRVSEYRGRTEPAGLERGGGLGAGGLGLGPLGSCSSHFTSGAFPLPSVSERYLFHSQLQPCVSDLLTLNSWC